ncbi:MAG: hypothetical protein JNM66_06115 [Bryobacterales bacterium]|nr:hypothetical protein [Bryobacterales bacterium]
MIRLIPAILAALFPLYAQTVSELVLERVLTPETVLATASYSLPPGAFELRERLIYNPSGATLTSTVFTVQPGSPLPTPLNASLSGSVLGVYTLAVEKLFLTTRPLNSASFIGTVAGSSGSGIFGNVNGMPFTVSMGFTGETPTRVSDLLHVIAGRVALYSASAAGTLVIPRPPAPPENPAGPKIVLSVPANTVSRQIELDASKSTDDSGTSLTFSWRNVNKSAVLLNPNTATAQVQFTEGPGDYTFEVTVTNGNGQSAKQAVTITYFGR